MLAKLTKIACISCSNVKVLHVLALKFLTRAATHCDLKIVMIR